MDCLADFTNSPGWNPEKCLLDQGTEESDFCYGKQPNFNVSRRAYSKQF